MQIIMTKLYLAVSGDIDLEQYFLNDVIANQIKFLETHENIYKNIEGWQLGELRKEHSRCFARGLSEPE